MPTKYLSKRTIDIFHAVLLQIQALIFQPADKLNDRKPPLPRTIVDSVNIVLAQARTVLTRDVPVVRFIPANGPMTPRHRASRRQPRPSIIHEHSHA